MVISKFREIAVCSIRDAEPSQDLLLLLLGLTESVGGAVYQKQSRPPVPYLAKPQICGSVWVIPRFRITRGTSMENDNTKATKTSLPGPSLDQEEKATEPGAEKPRVR
ncbi:hypothetical protein PV328_010433 [Microctonus aethiopoides]|uniref:Uncharacterized protein n=1 Tax=Microctonus aethiopoides TaxID=144406 RepID=A0AA39FHP1_9HYME|nr:hypothetical protein PV328_010433 [Microctonus aethiopoides]